MQGRLSDLHVRRPSAEQWLVDTYSPLVEGIVFRVLGDARGLEDHVQEVFARVFARIDQVHDAEALKAFISSVAVFVAREAIRKRRRHRWLLFWAPEELPQVGGGDDGNAREGLRAFYRAVDDLGLDERVSFTLRYVEGLELAEVAEATGVSLATVKRRLQRAEKAFVARCRGDEVLGTWLAEGDRWL